MAQVRAISRLAGWVGYEAIDDWSEVRASQSYCVIRLATERGQVHLAKTST